MAKYAKKTTVPVARSRAKIQEMLTDWGIDEFFFGTSSRGEGIGFKYNEHVYKHNVPLPKRTKNMTDKQYEQKTRQRWRILYMSLKMKLEEISEGGISFEDQFLAQMCLPNGGTVGMFMQKPENIERLKKAKMPKMLTGK